MNEDVIQFEPIRIRYDGIDAQNHQLDLSELGKSAIGISKIMSTIAQFSATGNYKKSKKKLDFRVLVGGAEDNCITFEAILTTIENHDLANAMLAIGGIAIFESFKGIMKLFWKLVAGKPKEETKEYKDLLELYKKQHIEDQNKITRLISLVEKLSEDLRGAAIQATNPISISCDTLQFGDTNNDYFVMLDIEDREAIRTQKFDFSELETHRVLISELDMRNGTCMVSLIDDLQRRFKASITDPVISNANNAYGFAMNGKEMVTVIAKRKIYREMTKEFIISDINISSISSLPKYGSSGSSQGALEFLPPIEGDT